MMFKQDSSLSRDGIAFELLKVSVQKEGLARTGTANVRHAFALADAFRFAAQEEHGASLGELITREASKEPEPPMLWTLTVGPMKADEHED